MFYWVWWIVFLFFVGLFLVCILCGRMIWEFVLGVVIMLLLVCFLWMMVFGGMVIDLEMLGVVGGVIIDVLLINKLFVMLYYLVSDQLFGWLLVMCVVLILIFLVILVDLGLLVINMIMVGGDEEIGVCYCIIWGVLLILVIVVLIVVGGGGLVVLQDVMIIGVLLFLFVMLVMCVLLIKVLYCDYLCSKVEEEQVV